MVRFIAFFFMLGCSAAYGLDSLEFQLYGVTAKGRVFDIRPYGKDTSSEGDVDEPDGIHGEFYTWVGTETSGSFKAVGSCRVRHVGTYIFSCEKGTDPLSGVVYEGRPIDESQLSSFPHAKKLYRTFIKQYEYGLLAAIYRCKTGCGPSRPAYLILVWRGD